ncbi:TetR family transcriptional regulator [Clostridia bacterium]|nr:TetR family transcriptional regulator [Clostridia bacterium]
MAQLQFQPQRQRTAHNAERSRSDILQAAELHFAEKGFYGARIDEIAESAQINKRMLYAYFGSKEGLYRQVLLDVYKRMETADEELIARKLTGVELIRGIIGMYFDFLHTHPTFVSILMWENLDQARHLDMLPMNEVERPSLAFFAEEIRRGKEAGVFRATLDERQVVVSLITVCFANFSNRHTLSRLFACDLTRDAMVEIRKQHTIDMMLTYMTP